MAPPDLNLQLPYITAQITGIGGVLRAIPADFVVEEIPLYEASGTGNHLYLRLTRENLSTRDVVRMVESSLRLKPGSVGYAGLKDKDARTTQIFSIPLERRTDDEQCQEVFSAVRDALAGSGLVSIEMIGPHTNKLKVGHLKGNRFEITISEVTLDSARVAGSLERISATLRAGGVPNYLGPQRFGGHGDNALAGYELLTDARHERDKWLRRFLVTSYQSHLCNLYLARRVERGAFGSLLQGDVAKKHDTGGIFLVEDVATEQPRYAQQEVSFTAPMFGYKMKRARGEAAALEAEIEAETGITDSQWRGAHTEGTRRMGRILLSDLEYALHPQGVTMRFSLPKGAFATTVLREFMKVEGAELPSQEIDDETES